MEEQHRPALKEKNVNGKICDSVEYHALQKHPTALSHQIHLDYRWHLYRQYALQEHIWSHWQILILLKEKRKTVWFSIQMVGLVWYSNPYFRPFTAKTFTAWRLVAWRRLRFAPIFPAGLPQVLWVTWIGLSKCISDLDVNLIHCIHSNPRTWCCRHRTSLWERYKARISHI